MSPVMPWPFNRRALARKVGIPWLVWVRLDVKDVRLAVTRGRPFQCHTCGGRIRAGHMIQRVRVPALPWQKWRHHPDVGCEYPYPTATRLALGYKGRHT